MNKRASSRVEPIAVVGIGCRFPGGANDPASFWELLSNGVDAITEVPPDRWSLASYFDSRSGIPGKTRARHGGFIDGIDQFDPEFFGISPREAPLMDPQHRLLLEVAWDALEDGGQTPDLVHGSRTGVFVGLSTNDYSLIQTSTNDADIIEPYTATGVAPSVAPNRISHCFNFRGPSIAIDTACSSSLVGVHLACRSLRSGECDTAIVAGVNCIITPSAFIAFSAMSMLSPEGRCKAFDAAANGFVRSEGAGAVVLKPLRSARADGDPIYAVIRGTAMNQDGRTPGMTMPDQTAQEMLVREACRDGGVSPASVQFVEAHGTGTPIGDPIELAALSAALCRGRRRDSCIVGSVKTNIGHLEAGAGIAGLIKLALVLKHRAIPPNLHFNTPNPAIDFDRLKLRIPTKLSPFPKDNGALIGAVNSFGFGGTNAHAVLESPPPRETLSPAQSDRPILLPVSARSAEALGAITESWRNFLQHTPAPPCDIAHSASTHRLHHPHRAFAVGCSARELGESLSNGSAPLSDRRVVFVFSGQGAQWAGMGSGLLDSEPVFRDKLIECDTLLRKLGGWSLIDELSARRNRLDETEIAQPAILSIQVALAALWKSWGIQPSAVVGHSVGEVAAAHEAGVLSLRDAMRVICHRARCMSRAKPDGRMLAVGLSVDELRSLNGSLDRVALAAVNSPTSITLAGDRGALGEVARELKARGIFHREVPVRYAFHSSHMDPVERDLVRALRSLQPKPARIPIFSTVTGTAASGLDFDAGYWWRNVRETVHFADAVNALQAAGHEVFVEVNAHPVLGTSLRECLGATHRLVVPTLRRGANEATTMLTSLGQLYTAGCPVDWRALHPGGGEFVSLPRHPMQRTAHWHESERSRRQRVQPPDHPLLGRRLAVPDPEWETKIDRRNFPYLADHRINDHVVLPAAACVEMSLAMTSVTAPGQTLLLEDIEFQKLVFLPDAGPAALHAEKRESAFRIRSRNGDSWMTHATGNSRAEPSTNPPKVNHAAITRRCKHKVPMEEFYAHLADAGLQYGPTFRGVQEIRCLGDEALGRILLDGQLSPDGHLIHPAFLDACFHMLAAPLHDRRGDVAFGVYSPWRIGRLRFFAPPGREAWLHVRLRKIGMRLIVADMVAFADDGGVFFEIEGFEVRLIESSGRGVNDLLFEPQWRVEPLAPLAEAIEPGTWLILDDDRHTGKRLAGLLRRRGARCEVSSSLPSGELSAFSGVLDFRCLDATTNDLDRARELACNNTLHLVQRLVQQAGERLPQLWLITKNAQPTGSRAPVSVAAAAAWGLGRVIMSEHRALRCRLVDLSDSPGELAALCDEVLACSDEAEIAFRGRTRHVLRIAPTSLEAPVQSVRTHPCRLETTRPGVLENLVFQPAVRRAPGPGEVEIEVASAGLNFRDVMKALGVYPTEDTITFGDECAGRIAAVGSGVSGLRVGDDVMALANGCFGPFVTTPAAGVVRKPAHLTMAEAATIPVAFLTAWHALIQLGRIKRGERVLIHAAAGGVGLAAVQVAQIAGAEIFATAGSTRKRAYLRRLGVKHVMDSRSLAFADEVMRITEGQGVDLILNSLAGSALEKSLTLLAQGGRFLEIGKRDIYEGTRIGLHPFRKNAAFFSIDLGATLAGPALRLGLRSLKRQFDKRALAPLPVSTHPLSRAADAFNRMARAQHIGKVALSVSGARVPISPPPRLRLSAHATYLITGGTGGVGLTLAQWLVGSGARHLVLTNRSGKASAPARTAISAMRAQGARVRVEKCDAGSESSIAAALARIEDPRLPLRGVFHLATTVDDGVLTQLTPERFRSVFAAKADGAWHLHRLTRTVPLDYFVLFSSVSSVFGNPGQGNYAAANGFLDALAHHRRAEGLHALVVNWGPFGEVGYAARTSGLEEHLARMGWKPLKPGEAMRALETLLLRDSTHSIVAHCDWSKLPEAPRYRELVKPDATAQDGSSTIRAALLQATPAERAAMMEEFVRVEIGRVLRTSAAKVERDRSLNEFGLDSLMAVELLNRVEAQLGIVVPTAQLMGGLTLAKLSDVLLGLLKPADAPSSAIAESPKRDLRSEVHLDPAIRWDAPLCTQPARSILLTDATDFAGAFLLRELITSTTADIHCLIPAPNIASANARVEEAMRKFCPATRLPRERVIPVLGTASEPRFGLSPAKFGKLAGTIEAVFHNAAQISHVASYEHLRKENVIATHEVIRFASAIARKPLHYVSSVSVFAAAENDIVAESDLLSQPGSLGMGYAESRWVAEQMLVLARGSGLPVSIYRPGYLTGDSTAVTMPPDGLLWRFVRTCIELQRGPSLEYPTNITPVDHFARAVVSLAKTSEAGTWHLISPEAPTLRTLLASAKRAGHPLRLVSKAAWERSVAGLGRGENPMLPYLLFYPGRKQEDLRSADTFVRIESSRTQARLRALGVKWPAIDDALLARYFRNLAASGALRNRVEKRSKVRA